VLTRQARRLLKSALNRAPAPLRDHTSRFLLRAYESYLGIRQARREGDIVHAGLPVPPPRLRVTVVGHTDVESFLETGRHENRLLRDTLTRAGCPVEHISAILDWGCGCGRLTRWWSDLDGPTVHACDYNGALATWVGRNLPFVTATVNQTTPPLPYDDATFDLVYALSVLTHLDDDLALIWMREIERVLKPGGHFFFTAHGDAYRNRLSRDDAARFDAGESIVHFASVRGTNLCAAYHPRSWVESFLIGDLKLVEVTQADGMHTDERSDIAQDRYLVRKPVQRGTA